MLFLYLAWGLNNGNSALHKFKVSVKFTLTVCSACWENGAGSLFL